MSALDSSELEHICASISAFTEQALERAIEQAREPAKADQFLNRLQLELEEDCNRFSVAALCVVLSEARVEAAIPTLLEEATSGDLPLSQEAATYALQRMGRPALEATMRLLEAETDPVRRVLAYEILPAALDADPDLRGQVTEFCLRRAEIELADSRGGEAWNPAMRVCSALVQLGETRVRSFLMRGLAGSETDGDQEMWQTLLDDLNGCRPSEWPMAWQEGWPERCRDWADTAGQELDDASQDDLDEQRYQEYERLCEAFSDSPFAQGIEGASAELASDVVYRFLRAGQNYTCTEFSVCNAQDVSEVLFEIYPQKISGPPEVFERLPRVLEAFVRFMHDSGRLADPAELLELLSQARHRLPLLAADPANWGLAKTIVMSGVEAGYDMTTPEGAAAWMQEYNQRLRRRHELAEPVRELPTGPVVLPIRRSEERVGRNELCVCGSGKKYKKCCGR